jgi:hypothetical protein
MANATELAAMVDRRARALFSESIRALVAGQITNDEFEDQRLAELNTSDPAILAIYEEAILGGLYSDLHEYRLRGKYAVSRGDKSHVARWILFLRTELPYEWPRLEGFRYMALLLANFLSFCLASRFYRRWFAKHGDLEIWPFIREEDYVAARRESGYLGHARPRLADRLC